MQKKQKNIHSIRLDDIFFSRGNRVRLSQSMIASNICREIAKYQLNTNFRDDCIKVLKHPCCPNTFKFLLKTIDDTQRYRSPKLLNLKSQLDWLVALFLNNKDIINEFLQIKKEIDICVLNGDGEQAISLLDSVDLKCHSLWGTEMRMNILGVLMHQNIDGYIEEIKNTLTAHAPKFLFSQLQLKAKVNDVKIFIKNSLYIFNEMRETDGNLLSKNYADSCASLFIPIEFDQHRDTSGDRLLLGTLSFSIIDQYMIFRQFVFEKLSLGEVVDAVTIDRLRLISTHIKDEDLLNVQKDIQTINLIDYDYMEIIKDYTLGDYGQCIEKILVMLEKNPLATSLVEIFVKCLIYTNENSRFNNKAGLFFSLANHFRNIYECNKECMKSIEYIENILIKFHLSTWTIPISYYLHHIANIDNRRKLISAKKIRILGDCVTPKMINMFNIKDFAKHLNVDIEEIPSRRLSKLALFEKLNDGLECDIDTIKIDFKIVSELIRVKSEYLLTRDITECCKLFVEEYLHNEAIFLFFPMHSMVKEINTIGINELIVFDVYSKKISHDKDDDKKKAYQQYMESLSTHKPSTVFQSHESLTEAEIYFLYNLCIPPIMDACVEFDSSDEVKNERIDILNMLRMTASDFILKENIDAEREVIFSASIRDKLKKELTTAKLYIDIENITKNSYEEYVALYEMYANIEDEGIIEDEIVYTEFMGNEETTIYFPANTETDLLSRIYQRIIKDFVRDENYGFDKYLSINIRHGEFVGKLRLAIDKNHLTTEMNENNEYGEFVYFAEQLKLLTPALANPIQESLKNFAKSYDEAIRSANNWFKVATSADDSGGSAMFNFIPIIERVEKLKYYIGNQPNAEMFYEQIIKFVWEVALQSAFEIKKRIKEELECKLLGYLDELERNVEQYRQGVGIKDLFDLMGLARRDIIDIIDDICKWLAKTDNDMEYIYHLSDIVNECCNMYKLKAITKNCEILTNNCDAICEVSSKQAKVLMSSVFMALENAISNGVAQDYGKNIIKITSYQDEISFSVEVINKIERISKDEQEAMLRKINEKFSEKHKMLSVKEGGTGLYKIYNMLINLDIRNQLCVNITDNEFFYLKIKMMK